MRKQKRLWISLMLCLTMMLASFSTVQADEEKEEKKSISIESAEEFVKFAEDCRLDAYSENLTVELTSDIDLTGIAFAGIPTFGGIFNGNEHVIQGLDIQTEGSAQGLFRYVRAGATIKNLKLEGKIAPTGSRSSVGGLAGENSGAIENCSFSGSVSGTDRVGGLVGYNQITGVIEACHVSGHIQGDHFVGGLTGENNGVIRQCQNEARINTTVQENSVEIADISLESVMESESAVTVTDVGGIAGASMGVIRECENLGSVGYPQIGYNIGGIAGSQSGYIVDCVNRGEIMGRKEVGGIVGQMEPAMRMQFDEDTLQKLQDEMDTMMGLTGQTMAAAQGSIADVNSQISTLKGHVKDAQNALDQMTPDVELPELGDGNLDPPEVDVPDLDTVLAAQNNLSSSISSIPETVDDMVSSTQSALGSVSSSMQALSNQMYVIGDTVKNAQEDLGGSVSDVSDEDTEEDTNAKVAACINYGNVTGDLNVGGITGAMAFENSMDPEADMEISGSLSLNFEGEVRVVALQCENQGDIAVNKQNGGGIAGRMSLGLLRECVNRGAVQGDSAHYVGGIAGRGDSGYIRNNSVRCAVSGAEYVGGVAGTAATVSDCSSLVQFEAGAEKLGAVLGNVDEMTEEIKDNYYLPIGSDIGGIDGISYDGSAQPVSEAKFFKLENLPEDFNQVSVRFVLEDGTEKVITLDYGGTLDAGKIPAVPEKDGYSGRWDGLEAQDVSALYFDVTFRATYDACETVVASAAQRADGRPILLVSSEFGSGAGVTLDELTDSPVLASEDEKLLEAWTVKLNSQGESSQLRYLPAENLAAKELAEDGARIMARDGAGNWRSVSYTVDGSYFVFELTGDDSAFCLVQTGTTSWLLYGLIGAGVLIAGGAVAVSMVIKRRKKNASKEEAEG